MLVLSDVPVNTLDELIHIGVIIMAIWGFYKVIMEIIQAITKRHDKEKHWSMWEIKIQQTQSELFILTECMSAVLDGLKQLNCNGPVTEAKKNLDEFLMNRAHDL